MASHAFVIMLPGHRTSHTINLFTLPSCGKLNDLGKLCLQLAAGRLTIPDGQFTIPDGQFPIPDGQFPIPDGQFTIPDGANCCLF